MLFLPTVERRHISTTAHLPRGCSLIVSLINYSCTGCVTIAALYVNLFLIRRRSRARANIMVESGLLSAISTFSRKKQSNPTYRALLTCREKCKNVKRCGHSVREKVLQQDLWGDCTVGNSVTIMQISAEGASHPHTVWYRYGASLVQRERNMAV
jgi:hypothetical protein